MPDLGRNEAKWQKDVAARIAAAIASVNGTCGDLRCRLITSIPGQDMIYMAKETEAARYIADPAPDPADYPLIASEEGITAPTIYEVAQIILNKAAGFRTAGAAIERVRLGYIAQLEVLTDPKLIPSVLATFEDDFAALKGQFP